MFAHIQLNRAQFRPSWADEGGHRRALNQPDGLLFCSAHGTGWRSFYFLSKVGVGKHLDPVTTVFLLMGPGDAQPGAVK
jgi:hypothetical protein